MKKSCLEDWLNALRSPNYTRCNGALHRDNGFCAFGVLCDISKLDTWKPDPYSNKLQYLGEVNYLPQQVRNWAGMDHKEYNVVSGYIICFNDNLKMGLPDIAKFLEEKYKKKSNQNLQ